MVYRAFTNGLFDTQHSCICMHVNSIPRYSIDVTRYPAYVRSTQLDTRRTRIPRLISKTRDTQTLLDTRRLAPTHLSAQHPDPTRYPTRGPDSPQRATPRPCSIPDAILDRNSIPRSQLSNLRSPHLLRSQLSPSPDRQTIPHSMVSRMHSNQKARVLSALCSATTPIPTLPERFKFESSSSCRRRCGVDHEAQRELQLPKSNRAPPRSGVPTGGQAAENPDHRPSCAQIGVAMAP